MIRPARASLFLAVIAIALIWPALAHAQATAPAATVSVFALLLPGIIAFSTQVATAMRDALSRRVPPRWFTASPEARPWYAAIAGAVVAFLAALGAAVTTGAGPTAIAAAAGAALANLSITIPKLIYAESQA